MNTVEGTHLVLFCLTIQEDVHYQFFSEGGLVLKIKNDLHKTLPLVIFGKVTNKSFKVFSLSQVIWK